MTCHYPSNVAYKAPPRLQHEFMPFITETSLCLLHVRKPEYSKPETSLLPQRFGKLDKRKVCCSWCFSGDGACKMRLELV